jgi:hypothetical protein
MSRVSFCLNCNPDLKVGAKDRVPFKFLFHLFWSFIKISTSLQAGDKTRQESLALAINSLLSSFHFAAHTSAVLF